MNRYLPSKLLYQRIIFLCSLTLAFNGQANNDIQNPTLKNNCSKQNIHFQRNTIFDEQDKDILFFHRWVNALHITTKQITLKNEAAFFLKKCHKTEHDLAELERHLRGRKFIRDAKVTTDASLNNITVETWDNWSLMPTFSYGRKGGVNTYSVGIKDRNLLGLGIDAQLQSFSNAQRSGYKLDTTVPLFLQKNTELILRIADNNDGKQNALFINKAFAGLDTDYAYSIGFNDEKRSDTLFQNGQTLTSFRHNIAYKTVNYSWLSQSFYNDKTHSDDKLRYSIGITQNRNVFSPSEPTLNNKEGLSSLSFPLLLTNLTSARANFLPQNRDFTYPWFKVEYIEQNFKKLTNIHLVTQIEDFNFGWHISAQLGIADGKKANSAWALWRSNISRGFSIGDKSLALVNVYLASDIYNDRDNRILARSDAELFYNLSDNLSFYLANTTILSQQQYVDQPITLGGESGMRGFPLQYQHGKNSTKFTAELRYYPHINLYKLFELAGATFIDVGKASGASLATNIDNGWLYSIGIGARIYSTHASEGRVVHIDLVKPFSDNPDLNGFEIRFQGKETF